MSTSVARISANRLNALKSTGPRTLTGKRVSRMNALKHGLASDALLVLGEDEATLGMFEAEMLRDLRPRGAAQQVLVHRMIRLAWKLRRAESAESRLFRDWQLELREEAKEEFGEEAAARMADPDRIERLVEQLGDEQDKSLERLEQYERRLERRYLAMLRELQKMKKARAEESEEEKWENEANGELGDFPTEQDGGSAKPQAAEDADENSAERTQCESELEQENDETVMTTREAAMQIPIWEPAANDDESKINEFERIKQAEIIRLCKLIEEDRAKRAARAEVIGKLRENARERDEELEQEEGDVEIECDELDLTEEELIEED